MKKAVAVFLLLSAAVWMTACGGASAGSASGTSQSAGSDASDAQTSPTQITPTQSAAETEMAQTQTAGTAAPETAAAALTENDAAPAAIPFTVTGYARRYPGVDDEDLKFVAAAEFIHIDEKGHEALEETLDGVNTVYRDQADHAFKEQAKTFAEFGVDEYARTMLPFSSETFVNVRRADSLLFSFSTTDTSWLGGAHPYSYQVGHSFDSASGRRLELKDVVADYDAFYQEVHRQLSENEDREYFFEDWEDTLKAAFYGGEQEVSWLAGREGVEVWFNQYDIAPYAFGPVFLEIRAKEHPELVKAELFPDNVPVPEQPGSAAEKQIQVTDLCNEYFPSGEEYGIDNVYRLPQISGADTAYIREVNAEIASIKEEYVDRQIRELKDSGFAFVYHTGYSYETLEGITSVRVSIHTENDYSIYYCWNFRPDGTKAENEELFALYGMSAEDFVKEARALLAERVNWDISGADEGLKQELARMQEETLSEKNCNAGLPLFISGDGELCFVARVYVPAGAGEYNGTFVIPGTEHRSDGLTKVRVNPQTAENIVRKGDCYMIGDNTNRKGFMLDDDTVIIEKVPCYDGKCGAMEWMERYLANPAAAASGSRDGFAAGDILHLLVDEKGHISVLEGIYYWD